MCVSASRSPLPWVPVACTCSLAALWGCASQPPAFTLEKTAGKTFVFMQPLAGGTRLSFISLDIKPTELLVLQRCGEGCATAK